MKNNGITLIALVITIIILIILAGVGISLSLGENGLIKKAKQAKEEFTNAQIDEKEKVNELEENINNLIDEIQIGNFRPELSNIGTTFISISLNLEDSINVESYKYCINNEYKESTEKQIEVTNLQPDTEYNIYVVVVYKNKEMIKSQTVKIKTLEKVYLYKEGNEYEDLTNGWSEQIIQSSPEFSKENSYLYIDSNSYVNNNWDAGYFYTNNSIDFSKYTKVVIRWSKYKSIYFSHFTMVLGDYEIHSGDPGTYIDSNHLCYTDRNYLSTDLSTEITETLEFDITTLTKSGKAYLYCFAGYLKIHEMWLQ